MRGVCVLLLALLVGCGGCLPHRARTNPAGPKVEEYPAPPANSATIAPPAAGQQHAP